MIRCIVFDFDGTLVVSNHIKRQTFYEVTYSYDPSGTTVTRILQNFPNKDRYGIFREIARECEDGKQIPQNQRPENLAAQWAEAYTIRCEQAISICEEIPGTFKTLQWIFQQNIPIFINSRTPTSTLQRIIASRSFNQFITDIYGAPASKSENLRKIQERIKIPSHEILMVGDSEDDRQAALEIGCHFVGVILEGENRFTYQPNHQIADLFQLQTTVMTFLENSLTP